MPKKTLTDETYRAARRLLPEMDDDLRRSVEDLLAEAERGVKTDNRIIELICRDDRLRQKMRELLKTGGEDLMLYFPPGGPPVPPPARKYVCPQCDYTRYIQQAGEDPGECPTHHVALMPFAEKKADH